MASTIPTNHGMHTQWSTVHPRRKIKITTFAGKCMEIEIITLSEINHTQKR
jgi:hypothetical protein